ncbi:hypothetical protein UFOVP117_244 [uncultured Caudovirales phage]|uniref:Uncharacterized protein n=1 Tax=uncultured Caudovirales phage TaxID=2100421 RepID=A0A6J5L5T5_9CAUD|nr:hypothetical protein UFOVP117_244 [uncultured Caudovirales phage]
MNLHEHIRRVLREELNKKYLKPNEKSEKFILGRLNNMGSGTEMYHIKNYKTRHDFEFCKNGKLVMNLAVFFEDTEDNTPTSDRKFETSTLSIHSDFVDGILSAFPVRRNYFYYLIEEWFEDTFLNKISNMMGRNDISVDELSLSDRTDVCVPPMTKPDDVTQDEMIDFILKKTLFRIDDLLRYEKEEPGYIEDLYLKKLRNDEEERLRR